MARFDLVIKDGKRFILEVGKDVETEHGPFSDTPKALAFIRQRQKDIAEKIGTGTRQL